MTVDITKLVFPLEDKYISKVEMYEDGFYYAKVPNGSKVKAPFDCVVKSVFKTNEKAIFSGALNVLLEPERDVYRAVFDSKDGKYQFSVSDILPNDKALNVGESFKAGENIGFVLSPDSSFAYTYYESKVVNPEAPRRDQTTEFKQIAPDEVQQQTTESANAEREAQAWKLPSKATMVFVAVLATTVFYIAKRYK